MYLTTSWFKKKGEKKNNCTWLALVFQTIFARCKTGVKSDFSDDVFKTYVGTFKDRVAMLVHQDWGRSGGMYCAFGIIY